MVKISSQQKRFVLVGIANTTIDFVLLFICKSFGLPIGISNIISTTAAFCFSFYANRKYTFHATETSLKREIPLFILVTLTGMWGLQTLVLLAITPSLSEIFNSANVGLFIAKCIATGVTLVWNYIFYSRLVFKK